MFWGRGDRRVWTAERVGANVTRWFWHEVAGKGCCGTLSLQPARESHRRPARTDHDPSHVCPAPPESHCQGSAPPPRRPAARHTPGPPTRGRSCGALTCASPGSPPACPARGRGPAPGWPFGRSSQPRLARSHGGGWCGCAVRGGAALFRVGVRRRPISATCRLVDTGDVSTTHQARTA